MAQIKDDLLEKKIATAMLIMTMKMVEDKSQRALLLQSFVQQYGPIPDDYKEKVLAAMERGDENVSD